MKNRPSLGRGKLFILLVIAMFAACARRETATATATAAPPKPPARKITIAQAGDFFLYAPLYVAQDGGYFKKNGLDVTIVSTGGDDKTWAAVVSGAANFGMADPTFVAVSDQRGVPGRVVASIVNGVPFWGVTFDPRVPAIREPRDLRGHTVATFPSPSTAYTLQAKMFRDGRLKPSIREGAFGTILAMLKSKQADIGLELEPNVSAAVKDGARVVYSLKERYGDFAITGLTATPAALSADPELAKQVVCSIQQALTYIHRNPEGTLALLGRRFPEIDQVVAKNALQRVTAEGIIPSTTVVSPDAWSKAIALRHEAGDIPVVKPYDSYVDPTFATWAASSCK